MPENKNSPELETAKMPQLKRTKAKSDRLRLVVMNAQGVKNLDLPQSGQVTVGRGKENDIQLEDSAVSRNHIRIDVGEQLTITDLESANGSRVRDQTLKSGESVEFAVGDSIDIGQTLLVVQRIAPTARPRRLCSHAYFELRLEEECQRATVENARFAIMRLHVDKGSNEATVNEAMALTFPRGHLIASYGPGEFEILLLSAAQNDAEEYERRLSTNLEQKNIEHKVGFACFPGDGRSPEGLISFACDALKPKEKTSQAVMPKVVVSDPAMQRIYKLIERVGPGNISVLLLGETGVGKEILAESVHLASPRKDKTFVRLNCAALTETLLESELFGHEKGSFTGATQTKQGLLESAQGGTVFLDEIGEMPLATQVKMLRVLEERKVMRVGGTKPLPIDVRFVSATNRNLEEEIGKGTFRQDLYFRLNGISFMIPPLRERPSEIIPLAQSFLASAAKSSGISPTPALGPSAENMLTQYSWPGNIRELRNTMERAILLCDGDQIANEHLPLEKMGNMMPSLQPTGQPFTGLGDAPQQVPSFIADEATAVLGSSKDIRSEVEAFEKQRIIKALESCQGNQTKAAEMLGMPRRTFINRLDAYGIPRPRKKKG